jgi:probable rRNA maturation factor
MIHITNENTDINVDLQQFEHDAQLIMNLMGYADFDLGILLTDNHTIQRFNRNFRQKDVPTDILSFPFYPELKAGQQIIAETDDEKNIGDLIISLEYIQPTCKEENKTVNEYLQTLLCHGICHLLGYDHYTQDTDKVMKEKEAWLAAKLAKNNE